MFQKDNFDKNRNYNKYRNYNNNRYRGNDFRRDSSYKNNGDHQSCIGNQNNSILNEIFCHFPVAIISLCVSVLFVIFYQFIIFSILKDVDASKIIYENLFHVTHYIHIFFSSMGSLIVFLKFSSKKYILGSIFASILSIFFCTISDIILPSFSVFFIFSKIPIHLCLFNFNDFINIIIFSILGIFGGLSIIFSESRKNFGISKFLHGFHVLMSCLAALFYLLSNIYFIEIFNFGFLVLALIFSVIVPCMISDVYVPIFFRKIFFRENTIIEKM